MGLLPKFCEALASACRGQSVLGGKGKIGGYRLAHSAVLRMFANLLEMENFVRAPTC